MKNSLKIMMLTIFIQGCTTKGTETKSNFFWLEDLKSVQSKEWVEEQNKKTTDQFSSTLRFKKMEKSVLGILNRKKQTKKIFYIGDEVAQISKETDTSRGVLQSLSIDDSRKPNPKWRDLVNFDILSKQESKNYIFGDAVCNLKNIKQCLFGLSINGANEKEYREYDLKRKKFFKSGFKIPKGNTGVAWIDRNTLLFASSFKGEKISKSGYGLSLKLWKRGELINQAKSILQVDNGDGLNPRQFISEDKSYILVQHWLDFYNGDIYYFKNRELKKLNIPTSHELYGVHKGFAILKLYKQWKINGKIFPLGSLVGVNLDSPDLNQPEIELIITQNEHLSFDSVKFTKSYILLNILEDMKTKPLALQRLGKTKLDNRWEKKYINKPSNDVLRIRSTSPVLEEAIVGYRGFLNPNSLYFLDTEKEKHRFWASTPKSFKTGNLAFSYHFAKGKDGVKIPYQMVGPKNLVPGKSYPVIIYVYGAYGEPVTAWHSSTLGKEWLSAGGIFVIANVRGGGAYGENWHQSAVRTTKHITTEDVSTVAKDLIQRKITNHKKIGVMGESLGGLTACSVAISYPQLINGAFCRSAITDTIRYTKFFDGSTWISELGDPDNPIEREYLLQHSPYHLLKKDIGIPPILLISYANDDVVHPSHSRRMVAKMEQQGMQAYLYESPEGGHNGATTKAERAKIIAIEYEFFKQRLFD